MALSASVLSAAIRANLVARPWARNVPELTQFCDDVANAVIAHITANAVVVPTLLVAPPGGGPVTGTGSIT